MFEFKNKINVPARIIPIFAMMSFEVNIWLDLICTSFVFDWFNRTKEAVLAKSAKNETEIIKVGFGTSSTPKSP